MEALRHDAPARMTLEEFERWNGGEPDGVYELVDGIVVSKRDSMSPESIRHLRYKVAAFEALQVGVRTAGISCKAFGDGATIRTSMASARVPDALVHCGEWDDDSIYLDNPVVMLEVVSPSGGKRDTSIKLGEYFGLPSVQHYLIVDPERRKLIWHRLDREQIVTNIVTSGSIVLDPPGFELDIDRMLNPAD